MNWKEVCTIFICIIALLWKTVINCHLVLDCRAARTMERKKFKTVKSKNRKCKETKGKTKAEIEDEIRKEMFEKLSLKIGSSVEKIDDEYVQFMQKYPKGKMTKQEFLRESKKFLSEDTRFLAGSLFRVFDEDDSGSIEFYEFMMASNCTKLSSLEDKLSWIFNVFDVDGGGTIDVGEVDRIIKALFKMSGKEVEQEVFNACIQNVVDALDEDEDGEITKEEFIQNAMKVGFIHNLMEDRGVIEKQNLQN